MRDRSSTASPLRRWREKRQAKRERTGPSGDARHEQRSADKPFDPDAVAKNIVKGKAGPPI